MSGMTPIGEIRAAIRNSPADGVERAIILTIPRDEWTVALETAIAQLRESERVIVEMRKDHQAGWDDTRANAAVRMAREARTRIGEETERLIPRYCVY